MNRYLLPLLLVGCVRNEADALLDGWVTLDLTHQDLDLRQSVDSSDLRMPPPDLSPECIFDRDCPDPERNGSYRCVKGACFHYLDPKHCGLNVDDCTAKMDPAIRCCPYLGSFFRAACTSIRTDYLNCGGCEKKCVNATCRDGLCIPN